MNLIPIHDSTIEVKSQGLLFISNKTALFKRLFIKYNPLNPPCQGDFLLTKFSGNSPP